jgi:hypothetical protein
VQRNVLCDAEYPFDLTENWNMKSAMLILAAAVLAAAVGCDNKPSKPDEKKGGVEVNAPGVKVETGNKAEGGGVEVETPGAKVDVNKKPEEK